MAFCLPNSLMKPSKFSKTQSKTRRRWQILALSSICTLFYTFFCKRRDISHMRLFTTHTSLHTHVKLPSIALKRTYGNEAHEARTETWRRPRKLASVHGLKRGSVKAEQARKHSWARPMVLSAYARRYKSGNVSVMTEVFVYATGVKMGHFNRSLFAVGCRVGRDVYEVYSRDTDVFVCVAPRAVKEEESVSVVLRDDAAARDLREGRTRKLTSGNATVEIQYVQGDLKELESEAEVKFDARWTGGYVEIRSDVTMQGGMDGDEGDAMRYDICLGTMLKPFTYMLGDWIDYHRRIGVDMVFVLDNHADTDLAEVYANRSDVEVGYWPWERAQDQGIGFLLVAGRARCKWMLLMDCDEYVLVGAGKNFRHAGKPLLKEYLKRVQTSPQMSFPYLTIGPSGHVYRPRVPVAEAYVYMHERQKRNGKVIAQTDFSWVESEVHKHRAREKSRKTERMQGNLYPEGMDEAPSLVHFQHRSLEERVMKREAGYASVTTRTRGDGRRRVLDVRNPPGFYKRKDEKMKYTYFRDMWRAVTKARGLREQRLVRAVGETECVVDVVLGEELPPLREGVCGA